MLMRDTKAAEDTPEMPVATQERPVQAEEAVIVFLIAQVSARVLPVKRRFEPVSSAAMIIKFISEGY